MSIRPLPEEASQLGHSAPAKHHTGTSFVMYNRTSVMAQGLSSKLSMLTHYFVSLGTILISSISLLYEWALCPFHQLGYLYSDRAAGFHQNFTHDDGLCGLFQLTFVASIHQKFEVWNWIHKENFCLLGCSVNVQPTYCIKLMANNMV